MTLFLFSDPDIRSRNPESLFFSSLRHFFFTGHWPLITDHFFIALRGKGVTGPEQPFYVSDP